MEKWQQGLAAAVATFERLQRVEGAAALGEAGQMSASEGKDSLERVRMTMAEEAVEEALAKAQVAADAAQGRRRARGAGPDALPGVGAEIAAGVT